MQRRPLIVRSAMFTVRDLIGGLVVAVAAGAVIDQFGKPLPILFRGIAIIVSGTLLFLGVRMWGRDIARIATGADPSSAGRATAIVVAPAIVIVALMLSAVEPTMVQRGASAGLGIHVVYRLLFVPATLLIAAVGSFALGRALYGSLFGARLAVGAGLAAAVAFLAINLVMDSLGWRVGAPAAGRRATMVVVTTLGISIAALAAGGVIGAMLPRESRSYRGIPET